MNIATLEVAFSVRFSNVMTCVERNIDPCGRIQAFICARRVCDLCEQSRPCGGGITKESALSASGTRAYVESLGRNRFKFNSKRRERSGHGL